MSAPMRYAISRRLTLYGQLLLLAFVIESCDLDEPPDRVYNDRALPPAVKLLDIKNLQPYQHVAGIVSFTFTPDTLTDKFDYYVILIDSLIIDGYPAAPSVSFQIDTRYRPQGEHLISIGLKEGKPNTGLIGLFSVPTVIYSVPLVFDQSFPSGVRLASLTWDNGAPLLSWRQSADGNFWSYRIWRGGNWGLSDPNVLYTQMYELDALFDRTATSYRDLSLPPMIGLDVKYAVRVSNRVQEATSDTMHIVYGNLVPTPVGPQLFRPFRDPVRDVLYIWANDTLMSFDSQSHTRLRSTRLGFAPRCVAMNEDGTSLFVAGWESTFLQYDPNDLSVVARRSVTSPWVIEGGSANRLYAGVADAYFPLKVIDGVTGMVLGQYSLTSPGNKLERAGPLAISPDRSTLFVEACLSPWGGDRDTIYRLNVAGDSVRLVSKQAIVGYADRMQVSPDGRQLLMHTIGSDVIDVWDAGSLTLQSKVAPPGPVSDFVVGPTSLYVAHSLPGGTTQQRAGRITQYSFPFLSEVTHWDFVGIPTSIQVSQSEHSVLAFIDNTFYNTKLWWEIRK